MTINKRLRHSILMAPLPMPHTFFDGEGEDESGGGGDADSFKLDMENPAVAKAVNTLIDQKIEGIRKNNEALVGEKRDMKAKLEEATAALSKFDGLDADKVRELLAKVDNDEEAKLIADGQVDEVIERRTERMRADFATQLAARDEKIAGLQEQLGVKDTTISRLVIDGQVNDAATREGVVATAMPDVLRAAKETFQIDDDGNPISRDAKGNLVMGPDGQTPLSITDWLNGLKETSPHWWPGSQGANAEGGQRGGGDDSDTYGRVGDMTQADYEKQRRDGKIV